uniref:Delta(14)-sterol reductase ERG24 n=1 Tax=Paramoeba aestuarina TaxID=180227 RepID=A0A7S4L3H8_9EUKA
MFLFFFLFFSLFCFFFCGGSIEEERENMSGGKKEELNPKTTEYEFMGPLGAIFMFFGLPGTVYGLFFICLPHDCAKIQTEEPYFIFPKCNFEDFRFFSWDAVAVVLGWFFFQVALERILPGTWIKGTKLRNGDQLDYKMNGLKAMFVSVVAVVAGHYLGYFDLAYLHDDFLALASVTIIFAAIMSVYLYVISFMGKNKLLALGGNSGNPIYDMFIGRELNPRIGSFDLKVFCELRPGLIGWVVLNLGMAAKQISETGSVTPSMILVNIFQFYYVFDALFFEPAIVTTMDITTDGFGFMLCFGDLVWVPFTYTLQCRFLATNSPDLGMIEVAGIVMLQLLGLYIFRGANSQKDKFRKNPNDPAVAHIKYIDTKRGTRLMISGWWGMSRHINYFGDWLMAWAWCLPCGFASPIPYFYVAYFAVLLIHRQIRDDHFCHQKYGKDWDKYCSLVPSRIVPYIY